MPDKITLQGVLMGPSGAGKTSLLGSLTDGAWFGSAMTTVGVDFKSKEFTVGVTNQIVDLQLWDTAGQERFNTMTRGMTSRSGINAFVVVTDWAGFDHCITNQIPHLAEIKRNRDTGTCPRFILLITKKDLGGGMTLEEAELKVKEKMENEDLVGRIHYVSAKTDLQQLLDIFQSLAQEMYEDYMLNQATIKQTVSINLNQTNADKDNVCCLFR